MRVVCTFRALKPKTSTGRILSLPRTRITSPQDIPMTNTFDTLRLSLQHVMEKVKFDLGRVTAEYPGGRVTSYNRREGEIIRPEQLRQMFAEARQDDQEAQRAQSAKVCVHD